LLRGAGDGDDDGVVLASLLPAWGAALAPLSGAFA